MEMEKEIENLWQDSVQERFIVGSDVRKLITYIRILQAQRTTLSEENERLAEVEKDYKALQSIMDRARKLAFAASEPEEDRVRFKMDNNGNLTRVGDDQ